MQSLKGHINSYFQDLFNDLKSVWVSGFRRATSALWQSEHCRHCQRPDFRFQDKAYQGGISLESRKVEQEIVTIKDITMEEQIYPTWLCYGGGVDGEPRSGGGLWTLHSTGNSEQEALPFLSVW